MTPPKKIFAVGKKAIYFHLCLVVSGGWIEINSIVSVNKMRFKFEK